MTKQCTRCGASFTCSADLPTGQCWCNDLPKIKPTDNSDCLCPVCLAERIEHLKATQPELILQYLHK
jgi:Zn finger protein HypA/HybF involved in hydrogenase expression